MHHPLSLVCASAVARINMHAAELLLCSTDVDTHLQLVKPLWTKPVCTPHNANIVLLDITQVREV